MLAVTLLYKIVEDFNKYLIFTSHFYTIYDNIIEYGWALAIKYPQKSPKIHDSIPIN